MFYTTCFAIESALAHLFSAGIIVQLVPLFIF